MPEEEQKTVTGGNDAKEGAKSIISTIAVLIAAPLIAIFITTYVFQSYEVDGPSMQTTLEDNDRLIVFKLPRTIARITKKDYLPGRGDIIIFNREGTFDPAVHREKQLIKRIIGLPGERVVVDEGKITVYNDESPDGFSPDNDEAYSDAITYTPGKVDLTVPAGEVFVAGDNRSNSLDSRSFGTIPARDIVGKLIVRLLPINSARGF